MLISKWNSLVHWRFQFWGCSQERLVTWWSFNWTVAKFVIDKHTTFYFEMSALHHCIKFQTQLQLDKHVFHFRLHVSVKLTSTYKWTTQFCSLISQIMVSSDRESIRNFIWQIVWENIASVRWNSRKFRTFIVLDADSIRKWQTRHETKTNHYCGVREIRQISINRLSLLRYLLAGQLSDVPFIARCLSDKAAMLRNSINRTACT